MKITKKGASLPCLGNLKNLQFPLMFFMGRWRLKLDTKYVSKRLVFFFEICTSRKNNAKTGRDAANVNFVLFL